MSKTRIPRLAIQELKSATMACWWPDKVYYPGRQTDWPGIIGELEGGVEAAKWRDTINGTSEASELRRLLAMARFAAD